jgi:hypothetical protein
LEVVEVDAVVDGGGGAIHFNVFERVIGC